MIGGCRALGARADRAGVVSKARTRAVKAGLAFKALFAVVAATLMASCGDNKVFTVDGTVDGLGTQNLHLIYESGEAVHSGSVTAVDSKFRFEGDAPEETVVEVFNNSRKLVGRFVAKNGDALKVELSTTDPLFLATSGNKTGDRLAEFLAENSADDQTLRSAIERYVESNPAKPLSGILLAYYYAPAADYERALQLYSLLDYGKMGSYVRSARGLLVREASQPAKLGPVDLISNVDSIKTLKVAKRGKTLIVFDIESIIADSMVAALDTIARLPGVEINFVRLAPDTLTLYGSTRRLPKGANAFRSVGGVADSVLRPFAIKRLPLFVAADSTGEQIYRATLIDSIVKHFYR